MRLIKMAHLILFFNWIYFLIYNIYFGFNWESQSVAESNCDYVFKISLSVAIILYIIPLFRLYEEAFKIFLNNKSKSE